MASKDCSPRVNLSPSNTDGRQVNDNNNSHINYSSYRSISDDSIFPISKSKYINSKFFRFLPPVNSYFKALGAIREFSNLDKTQSRDDEKLKKVTSWICLNKSDIGFKELIGILNERHYFGINTREIDKICYSQTIPKIDSSLDAVLSYFVKNPNRFFAKILPECEVEVIAYIGNVEKAHIHYSTGISPQADFTREVEDYIRRKFTVYVIGLLGAWLLLNTFLILYINIFMR